MKSSNPFLRCSHPEAIGRRIGRFILLQPAFFLASILLVLLAAGGPPMVPEPGFVPDEPVLTTGYVAGVPEVRYHQLTFELVPTHMEQRGEPVPRTGPIQVWIASGRTPPEEMFSPPLAWGDRLRFRVVLAEPGYHAVPGVPDGRRAAWIRGAYYRARLKSPLQVERLGVETSLRASILRPLFAYIEEFRTRTRRGIPEPVGAFVDSALLGKATVLTPERWDLLRRSGLVHLFVVSGFHVGLLLYTLHRALRPFGLGGNLAALAAIWAYAAILGFPAAATRATIMASVVYGAWMIGVGHRVLNGLGLAALALLAGSTNIVWNSSFHFTFLSVIAILAASPSLALAADVGEGFRDYRRRRVLALLSPELRRRRRIRFRLEAWLEFVPGGTVGPVLVPVGYILSGVLSLAAVSLAVHILLTPLMLQHSNQLSLSAVVNNVLAVPVFALFLPSAFFHLLLHRTPLAPISEALLGAAGSALAWLLEAMDAWNLVLHAPHPGPAAVVLYCSLVLGVYLLLPGSRLRMLVLLGPPLLLAWASRPLQPDGILHLTLLDVGQAECLHIAYPNGSHGMIDTGGAPFDESNRFLARRVVARYLRAERVPAVDFLLVSHPEADHRGAYGELDRVFPLRRVLFFQPRSDYRPPIDRIHSGMHFTLGGVEHRVIHPSPNDRSLDSNDQSLVVEIRFGAFSALLTGDVSAAVERTIRDRLNPVDVLKVAHHGSRTSTSADLLEAVRPRIALISAGRRNAFGHPHPTVLSRLSQADVSTFSTAEWGTLRVRTDGETWSLLRYSRETKEFLPVAEGPCR